MADTDKVRIPKWTFTLVMVASIVGILVIYFSTGFYNVAPSEVGLVKRFGKYVRTDQPGINYHLPAPFDSVTVVDVLSIRKIEIGFRTVAANRYASVVSEALMMTSDNNFASVECVIQYRIKDAYSFAFNIHNPEEIVKALSESVIRERVALRTVDEVLTSDRDLIAMEAKDRLQKEGVAWSREEAYALFFWPWAESFFAGKDGDVRTVLEKAFESAGLQAVFPRKVRTDVAHILTLVSQIMTVFRTGRPRWSLRRQALFESAVRIYGVIEAGRPPEPGAFPEKLFGRPRPSSGEPEPEAERTRRPRRRRRRKPRPPKAE